MLQIGNVSQICSTAFNAVLQPVCGAWNLFRPSSDASSYSSRVPAAAALAATLGGCERPGMGALLAFCVLSSSLCLWYGRIETRAVKNLVKAREIERSFQGLIKEGQYQSAYEIVSNDGDKEHVLRVRAPQDFLGKDIAFVEHTMGSSIFPRLRRYPLDSRIVAGQCVEVKRTDAGYCLVLETSPDFTRHRVRLTAEGYEVSGFASEGVPDYRHSTVYYRDSKPAA